MHHKKVKRRVLKGRAKSLILIMSLSLGLMMNACSADISNPTQLSNSKVLEIYQSGLGYYQGETVTQDYQEAFKIFYELANRGYPLAQYQLGLMYDKGEGVEQDDTKAIEWYKKAAA